MLKTPSKRPNEADLFTPPMQSDLRKELRAVLLERNKLTAKSKSKALSILDDLSSPENSPTKPSDLRKRAVLEILDSEKRYIEQLNVLINFFINPLKTILDAKSHHALFGQIEMMYNLNKELLNELEQDLENVAKAFLKFAPFFKLYSVYAFDYKNAMLRLQELTTERQAFQKFLRDTESRPEVQMKLSSLLITPIQRIPRYKLLLNQVQLYTSPSERDYKILQESIKEIENTVQHINSVIEDQEQTQSLINFQNSLVNRLPSIVKPSRKIIKEGILSKLNSTGSTSKYVCVLMSDIFVICRPLKKRSKNSVTENSLQCCCIYPLRKTKVKQLFSASFKITCQGDGNIFNAENDFECRQWVQSIKDIIERNIESRKTLRKESSKKKTIRKKSDLKSFGSDSVFSPPTQKGHYENIFKWGDYERKEKPTERGRKRKLSESFEENEVKPAAKKRGALEVIKSWFISPNSNNNNKPNEVEKTPEKPEKMMDFKSALKAYQKRPIEEQGEEEYEDGFTINKRRVQFNPVTHTYQPELDKLNALKESPQLSFKDKVYDFFSKFT